MLALAKIRWSDVPLKTGFLRGKDGSEAIDCSSGCHHLLKLSLVGTVRNVVLLEESNIIEDGTMIKRMSCFEADNTFGRGGEFPRISLNRMDSGGVSLGNILDVRLGIRWNVK